MIIIPAQQLTSSGAVAQSLHAIVPFFLLWLGILILDFSLEYGKKRKVEKYMKHRNCIYF